MKKSIISKYLDKIKTKNIEGKNYIYRGQSSKKYDFKDDIGIQSAITRRYINSSGLKPNEIKLLTPAKINNLKPSQTEYLEYHNNLIKDAKSYRYDDKLNDTELLLELQHYGAATGLIDFSEDMLIALWFACDNNDEYGSLFFLDVWNDKFKHIDIQNEPDTLFKEQETLFFIKTNFKSNNRIFAQKGVAIFGYQDINQGYDLDNIIIDKDDKSKIREELKKYFAIEEKTLFQDIYGFAQVNNPQHKLTVKSGDDYFKEAYEEKDLDNQIKLYKKAIRKNPNYDSAYYNMGTAYSKLKQYDYWLIKKPLQ